MMFWPSMMSLAPPPVTPSRKFPPRFGPPPAPPRAGLVPVDELLPHAAARPPATARPAAPLTSCRREISVMSLSFGFADAVLRPGRWWALVDGATDDVLVASGPTSV